MRHRYSWSTISGSLPQTTEPGSLTAPNYSSTIETMVYGPIVTPNYAVGYIHVVTVTNNTPFTVANPSNDALRQGQRLEIRLRNTSGGAMGAVTLGASYKAPALTLPANGFQCSYMFEWNGLNYVLLWQGIATVPN